MKLYFKPGACSLAAHIVLNEISADFALEKVDTEAAKTETGTIYTSINPNGYVPALAIPSGEIITENPAVLQYIGDLAPELGLTAPAGSMARTRLHEMLNFLSSELHNGFSPFFSGNALSEVERENVEAQIRKRIAFLENRLENDGFLLGSTFSVADAYAFVILDWSNFVGLELSEFPNVQAYMTRILARASVQKSMRTEGLIDAEAA